MFRLLIRLFYSPLLGFKRELINVKLPNLFSRGRLKLLSMPVCQQKLLITGKGNVEIGTDCTFGFKLGGFYRKGYIELQSRYPDARIKFGNNISVNNNLFICCANNIEIGSNTLIGQNVTMMDFEAHGIDPNKRREVGKIGEIIIGTNVWIGNNVVILRNSYVGENSIIAAGAIVKGTFPANVIIGGIPAAIIKKIISDAE